MKRMEVIQLHGTPVEDQYHGCGRARLAIDQDGEPVALSYDESGPGSIPPSKMEERAGPSGRVLRGMASCWEFCVEGQEWPAETPAKTEADTIEDLRAKLTD